MNAGLVRCLLNVFEPWRKIIQALEGMYMHIAQQLGASVWFPGMLKGRETDDKATNETKDVSLYVPEGHFCRCFVFLRKIFSWHI